jgi:hypothetical protein
VGLFVEDFPAASVVDQAVNVWKFLWFRPHIELDRDQIKVVFAGVELVHYQSLKPILHKAMTCTEYYQENQFVLIVLGVICLFF